MEWNGNRKQKKEYKGKLPDPIAPNVKFSLKSR